MQSKPFAIQLTYEPETHVVQPVRVGIDPGRTNIGVAAVREDGTCLFLAKVETRNKDIPKLMEKRKVHRHQSRRGERLVRKRRAKKNGTTMAKPSLKRALPGYKEGHVVVKDIINTEARFNNRRRPAGWLTPTVRQLLQTHQRCMEVVCRILPVSEVVIELNQFDFQRMDNPQIKRWEYGKGPLCGLGSIRDALMKQQNGVCLLCGSAPIDHCHHLVPRSRRGSDTLPNMAGLCVKCHTRVHQNPSAAERLAAIKRGVNKKYHALSCVNQMLPFFVTWLGKRFPMHTYVVQGYDTKAFRDTYQLAKDHDMDACCIALVTLNHGSTTIGPDRLMPTCHLVKQFRCHDRAKIKAQTTRTYKLGTQVVAKNRRSACEAVVPNAGSKNIESKTCAEKQQSQSIDSLNDWFDKMVQLDGKKEAMKGLSRLTVAKSRRRYNDSERILPGATVIWNGKGYVKIGQITGGNYLRLYGCGNRNVPKKDVEIVPATGLVFLT